jgi:NADH-quinone oxidoreductase subunit N
MSLHELRPLVPALIVALAGMAVLLAQAVVGRDRSAPGAAGFSMGGLLVALLATVIVARGHGLGETVGGAYAADAYALFFHVLILGIALVAVLLSPSYLRATGIAPVAEYYALLMFCVVGMLGLVSCTELVSLFVALEIMSVSLYAMAGLHRDRVESQESAMKYFITGAFSSAFLLYGIALLYGVSGSTTLSRIAGAVAARPGGDAALLPLLGVGLLLVGFGFKVASVPFHMWAPDVYEGAPTTVTALMAAGVKAAAFGGLLRVLLQAVPSLASDWRPAVAVLALLTMVVGNLGALAQTNVKRMLAYSSVAHAGYLLTAVVAPPGQGAEAVLFYLVAYAAVNLGGFGALAALARDGREPLSLSDLAGLSQRRPVLAAALTLFLISLAGVPVSGGFVGKFYLFSAAVNAGYVGLALVGVLASVISAYYYLRVVVAMYMREPLGDDTWSPVGALPAAALGASSLVVLFLGVYPAPLLEAARTALRSLL